MNCKKYMKWLHLYREGELTAQQNEKLLLHVKECPSCTALKIEIEETRGIISRAQESQPRLSDPGLLTADIMRSIRRIEHYPSKPNKILDFLSIPKVRLALAGFVTVLVGFFFIQEFLVLYRVSKLEERMAQQSWGQERIQPAGLQFPGKNKFPSVFAAREVTRYLSSFPLDRYSPNEGLFEKKLLINKQTLASLVAALDQLQQENKILRDILEQEFPGLLEQVKKNGVIDWDILQKLIENSDKKKLLEYFKKI